MHVFVALLLLVALGACTIDITSHENGFQQTTGKFTISGTVSNTSALKVTVKVTHAGGTDPYEADIKNGMWSVTVMYNDPTTVYFSAQPKNDSSCLDYVGGNIVEES